MADSNPLSRPLLWTWFLWCALLAHTGVAQCTPAWQPPEGVPGVSSGGAAAVIPWDPDGPGPTPLRVVVGGSFLFAGTLRTSRIAAYEPASGTWSPFASGFDNAVGAIVVMPNGDLVVGGGFGGAFGAPGTSGIARWNGTAWTSLGGGLGGSCSDLALLPNGDLIATGYFATAGGVPANGLARWNGTAWSAVGGSLGGAFSYGTDLALRPNGDLVVVGSFASAGGVAAQNIARWDGTAWYAIAHTFGSATWFDVAAMPNGDLFANPDNQLHRWNGVSWSAVAGSPYVTSLSSLANGDLVAAGAFASIGGVAARNLARWNGTTWAPVADANTPPYATAVAELAGGDVFVGGGFGVIGTVVASGIARWHSGAWQALGRGVPREVTALAQDAAGVPLALCLGQSTHLLRRAGPVWQAVGTPFQAWKRALAVRSNGEILVGGDSEYDNGWRPLHRWSGTNFAPVGNFVAASGTAWVNCLLPLPDGAVLVGGRFTSVDGTPMNHLARWDGSTWSALGGPSFAAAFAPSAQILRLARLANGDIVAAGDFTSVAGVPAARIARWNGAAWSSLGSGFSGFPSFGALLALPSGNLVVGGGFSQAGGTAAANVAVWNGSAWSQLGGGTNGAVSALALLPDGDLVLGGAFSQAGGVTVRGVARWEGASFSPFAAGVTGVNSQGGTGVVQHLLFQADGALATAGDFDEVNFAVAPHLAYLRSPCPAVATPFGNGCPSSGGSNTLTSTLPWVEGTLRTTGTGLPTTALVLTVTSVTPIAQGAVPLLLAFSQAGPGCDLLAAPDILGLLVTTNGTAESTLSLPDTPPLVGVTFYQQMVPIELDPLGNWVAVTATNSVQLTAGRF